MFQTRITGLFGIKYPIVQGGMHWVARAELSSAVCNAGGLGIISALTQPTTAALAAEINRMKRLTDRPFGVNVTFIPTLRPVNYDEYIDVIIREGVRIVETAGRSPEPYMGRLKAAGIKVIHKCTALRFARTAEAIGCDAVSVEGFECAGHPGEDDVTSLALIPLAVDAVSIPIIASGGFADGRGLVAAFALGAEGLNMGTRFLATREAPAHPRIKEWLVRASERDTFLLLRPWRNSERVLRNAISEKVAEMEKQGATLEQVAPLISGQRGKEMLETGELDHGLLTVSQAIGLVHSIPTVKEVIDGIVSEAAAIIRERLSRLAQP
ncbi:MAG: nitronate monooxygenase [Chloroflexota bacterium]